MRAYAQLSHSDKSRLMNEGLSLVAMKKRAEQIMKIRKSPLNINTQNMLINTNNPRGVQNTMELYALFQKYPMLKTIHKQQLLNHIRRDGRSLNYVKAQLNKLADLDVYLKTHRISDEEKSRLMSRISREGNSLENVKQAYTNMKELRAIGGSRALENNILVYGLTLQNAMKNNTKMLAAKKKLNNTRVNYALKNTRLPVNMLNKIKGHMK